MRATNTRLVGAAGVAALAVTAVVATAIATSGGNSVQGNLEGFQEVPSVSTTGTGSFSAKIRDGGEAIDWTLTYSQLEGTVQQAHIHFGQRSVNGGISAFFCTNLGNGPAGTQPCPPGPATVTGTITEDQVIGPTGQGIEPKAIGELVRALRRGYTYANVHSSKWPGGEIRLQLRRVRNR